MVLVEADIDDVVQAPRVVTLEARVHARSHPRRVVAEMVALVWMACVLRGCTTSVAAAQASEGDERPAEGTKPDTRKTKKKAPADKASDGATGKKHGMSDAEMKHMK